MKRKEFAEEYPFRGIRKEKVREMLSLAAQITGIQFAGKAENVPVFHLLGADKRYERDIALVLHPKKDWIGTMREGRIIWFDRRKMRDMRSALFLAEEDPENGFAKTVVVRENMAPM